MKWMIWKTSYNIVYHTEGQILELWNISANSLAYCRPAVWFLDKILFSFWKWTDWQIRNVSYLIRLTKMFKNWVRWQMYNSEYTKSSRVIQFKWVSCMVYEWYLNTAAKEKDEQENVITTQSSIFSLRQEKSCENHRKTCYGYAITKACS